MIYGSAVRKCRIKQRIAAAAQPRGKTGAEPPLESAMGNSLVKISVVIPVYNVEPYLVRCLETVVAQSFDGFEIILVDDGSTDGSAGICDDYAQRCGNVSVIH